MAERLQYPIWAAIDPEALGEAVAPEVVTLDEFQAFSVPVLPRPLQHPEAAIIDPTTLDAPLRDEIQWFQPLAEPVLPRHLFQRAEAAPIDPETLSAALRDEIQWFMPLAEPVLPLHQTRPGWIAEDPEAIGDPLGDKIEWFQAFSLPVLPRHQTRPGWIAHDPEELAAALRDELQWFRPLSEPIRRIDRLIEAGNILVDEPPAVVTDELEWFAALSQPSPLPPWRQPQGWFIDPEALSAALGIDTRRQRAVITMLLSRRRNKRRCR